MQTMNPKKNNSKCLTNTSPAIKRILYQSAEFVPFQMSLRTKSTLLPINCWKGPVMPPNKTLKKVGVAQCFKGQMQKFFHFKTGQHQRTQQGRNWRHERFRTLQCKKINLEVKPSLLEMFAMTLALKDQKSKQHLTS